MSVQHEAPADPKTKGPKPEYPQEPIAPPGLDSEMTPKADHGESSYKGLGRLKDRAAQPVEIAPVFVFLASNEARFVTGEVYGVTGGQTPY